MVSETILWKWVLSPVIVFPERWADNSPQDIPLACVTLPQGKQNRPHFFSKMGLIFRADRTLLTGTEDHNVCPTGMKNNTDTDTNSPYTKLVVPTKHIPGLQPGGPFQVPRSCCQDFPQLALTLSEVWINQGFCSSTWLQENLTSLRKKEFSWLVWWGSLRLGPALGIAWHGVSRCHRNPDPSSLSWELCP